MILSCKGKTDARISMPDTMTPPMPDERRQHSQGIENKKMLGDIGLTPNRKLLGRGVLQHRMSNLRLRDSHVG